MTTEVSTSVAGIVFATQSLLSGKTTLSPPARSSLQTAFKCANCNLISSAQTTKSASDPAGLNYFSFALFAYFCRFSVRLPLLGGPPDIVSWIAAKSSGTSVAEDFVPVKFIKGLFDAIVGTEESMNEHGFVASVAILEHWAVVLQHAALNLDVQDPSSFDLLKFDTEPFPPYPSPDSVREQLETSTAHRIALYVKSHSVSSPFPEEYFDSVSLMSRTLWRFSEGLETMFDEYADEDPSSPA